MSILKFAISQTSLPYRCLIKINNWIRFGLPYVKLAGVQVTQCGMNKVWPENLQAILLNLSASDRLYHHQCIHVDCAKLFWIICVHTSWCQKLNTDTTRVSASQKPPIMMNHPLSVFFWYAQLAVAIIAHCWLRAYGWLNAWYRCGTCEIFDLEHSGNSIFCFVFGFMSISMMAAQCILMKNVIWCFLCFS